MRLAERYRPKRLADVVGQPATKALARFVRDPYSTCMMFVGPAGTGKSSSALALATELGAVEPLSLTVVCVADLSKDMAQDLMRRLSLRPMVGAFNVLILEELERLHPQTQVYLKVALASENLPRSAIVLATSNDLSLIDLALRERFGKPFLFEGWGELAKSGAGRVAEVWANETGGAPLPAEATDWGWYYESRDGKRKPVRYSLRAALDCCQRAILELPEPAGLAA